MTIPKHTRPSVLLRRQPETPYRFNQSGFQVLVHRDVFPPDLSASSLRLMPLLSRYSGNFAVDMGCGTGLLALELSRTFRNVDAIDNHEPAVANTRENVLLNRVENVTVHRGDLFSGRPYLTVADLIVFNHPYYPSAENINFGIGADAGASLIRRFLGQAIDRLAPTGRIVMPFGEFAGSEHDPKSSAPNFGFVVDTVETWEDSLGRHHIYEFRRAIQSP